MTGCAGMDKDAVAILGANGMLGSDVTSLLGKSNLDLRLFDLPGFDITNAQQLKDALKDVDAVINCAAYTDVDKAESESEKAYKINAEAVGNLGRLAKNSGIWVLHISTDFVFDGKSKKPYTENDLPNPLNVYGKSKLAGEGLLVESGCQCCIMRVEWTYGKNGSNFVKKIIAAARERKELKVVTDQVGSPTATTEIAKVIAKLLAKRPQGLFHFASAGYASRFDVAKFIFEKLDMKVKLKKCKTADFPAAAARPLNSRFDCSRIQALLGEPIENWQLPLEKFLLELKSGE